MRGAVEVVGVTAAAMLSRLARPAAVLCRGLATSAQVRASGVRGDLRRWVPAGSRLPGREGRPRGEGATRGVLPASGR